MKLKTYLCEKGISQADFAREIEESPQNVGRYVNEDRVKINKDTMHKIFLATRGLVTANDFYDLPLEMK